MTNESKPGAGSSESLGARSPAPGVRDTPICAEYLRRSKEVADAVDRSAQMERDFLENKVLNREANAACAESLHKRREFAAWLMEHHAALFAQSESAPSQHAHRCMSCGESWDCPHPPGDCKAGESVFPTLVLRGPNGPQTFDHICQRKRNG